MIDYGPYLDSTLWPSESRTMSAGHGPRDPELIAVENMPPQHALSALRKLVRWATEYVNTEYEEAQAETNIRRSPLAVALARQALGEKDFTPDPVYSSNNWMGNDEVARLLLVKMAEIVVDGIPIRELGRLAEELALALNEDGYMVSRET